MVCKIKETKNQRVNGEVRKVLFALNIDKNFYQNVTNTEEREERIQVNNNNQMSPFSRQAGPAFPQNYEQSK